MKFLLFIFEFFNSAKNKNSRNQTSVMKVWCVNENVRNENEKRMPTLKRKHDDLRLTASASGQKKLASKPTPERQLKQRYLLIRFTTLGYWNEERLIKSLGFLECFYLRKRLTDIWRKIKYQILLFLGRWVIFNIRSQSSILAKFLSCNNKRKKSCTWRVT